MEVSTVHLRLRQASSPQLHGDRKNAGWAISVRHRRSQRSLGATGAVRYGTALQDPLRTYHRGRQTAILHVRRYLGVSLGSQSAGPVRRRRTPSQGNAYTDHRSSRKTGQGQTGSLSRSVRCMKTYEEIERAAERARELPRRSIPTHYGE
jgi:hypothetical protein